MNDELEDKHMSLKAAMGTTAATAKDGPQALDDPRL